MHFPRRRYVRTQPAALSRAATHRAPLDPTLRIGGSAPVRLQRRGGLRGRGSATSTWDGRVRRLGVGPRERGAMGPHGGPWNQATRVRREALEASPSSSHFHGHLGPPRAPPSLFSLQTGQLRFFQFFLEMGVLRLCLDGSWIMCFFGKFNVVLSLIRGYRWWWLLYKTLFFFAKSNGI